jgi:hypothetical protein
MRSKRVGGSKDTHRDHPAPLLWTGEKRKEDSPSARPQRVLEHGDAMPLAAGSGHCWLPSVLTGLLCDKQRTSVVDLGAGMVVASIDRATTSTPSAASVELARLQTMAEARKKLG